MITNVAVSTHADGCSTISPCVQQLLSKGNAGSSSQFCSPIAEFDLHVNVSVARPIAPVGTFGVPAMRGPAAPDRHAARSRGDPEDPRAPRPLPLGQCPGPPPSPAPPRPDRLHEGAASAVVLRNATGADPADPWSVAARAVPA